MPMEMVVLISSILMLFLFGQCSALICKLGHANHLLGEESKIGNCQKPGEEYCFSVICMDQNFTSTALLTWECSSEADKEGCEAYFVSKSNELFHSTKQRCECQFGERSKDRANEHVQLPEAEQLILPTVPASALNKNIQCKAGFSYGNELRTLFMDYAAGGEYCYAVNCTIESEEAIFWGCAEENDCEAIRKFFAYGQKCSCQIGEKGENLANANYMKSKLLPPAKMGGVNIVFNEIPIDQNSRANSPLLIASSSIIAFDFLTKFLLRALMFWAN